MARRLTPAPKPTPKPEARDLRESVTDAVAAMDWLSPSDLTLVDLALKAAEQVEAAQDRAEALSDLYADARGQQDIYKRLAKLEAMCDVTKTVGWLGPQIQGFLRDLGGTPASRKAMKPDQPIGGRLAELRARATGPRVDPAEAVD